MAPHRLSPRRLLQKKLGQRMLMDVIPLRADLVRGTHGRLAARPELGPVLIGSDPGFARTDLHQTAVKQLILDLLGGAG